MPLVPAIPAEDEEDDQAQAPKPQIGTTGGVIPEQQSDIDARKPVKWQADPMARQQQVRQEIDKRRQAAFQKDHPFTPSGWQPKINTPETRHEDREFHADAEAQFQYQEQSARANEVNKRRQGIAARNASNNQLEAQYRGSGQQFYTDADGVIQPIIDTESGRPQFHATGWEVGTHPKTGKPSLTMRDKYGQRQFKEPPVVQSLDPMDDQMHYKLPDGTTVAAGSIDDFAKSPNYTVAKAALAAKTRQVKAVHQEALQPIRLMADQAVSQLEDAKVELQGLDAEIEKISTQAANATSPDGSPTPLSEGLGASLAQLQARREHINGMVKPRGELAQKAARAKAGFAIASATAMREAFLAQQSEIAARVKATGGSLESDPTYQANLRGLRSAEQILGAGQQEIGAKAAPTPAPVGQPNASAADSPAANASPLEQSEPYIASQNGVKNVGSVKIDEFARRYGDGRGPVRPDQLIKLQRRSQEIDQVLSNDDSSINQTMRDQFTKEKDYIDSLAKQRFARLPEDEQKRVAEATRDPSWWDKLKGAGKTAAEEAAVGGGAVLKGAEQAADNFAVMGAVNMETGQVDLPMQRAITEARANETSAQKMDRIKSGPAYKLGSFIQEAARESYEKSPHEAEGAVSKALNAAAGAAGGFAPLVASGPMAPVTIGLQTAGEEMQRVYDDLIKKGVDPERAADFAQKRALASGAVQSALFEILPKPLQKLGNKYIVDKIAGNALKKFVANRIAQGAEGAVLGGATTAAGNVVADRPLTEGVAESAQGLALIQSVMPRAGGEKPKAGPAEPTAAEKPAAPVSPEQTPKQIAEAEFQKRLAEEPAPPAVTPPVEEPKSAAESAEVFAKTATGKPAIDSAEVFQKNEEAYKKDPIGTDPDRRIKELKEELTKLDADWDAHVAKVGAEAADAPRKQALEERRTAIESELAKADTVRKSPQGAVALKEELSTEEQTSAEDARKLRTPELTERRDAIEQGLSEAERVRQSNKGGADLKNDLAQRSGEPPAPPTSPKAAPKPAGPSPLGDQPVKVELRRGKTGETIEVEMPAKVAEKRINDHITTLDKVLACLGGGR